jgi:uncharacterized protein (TIGR02145 family)
MYSLIKFTFFILPLISFSQAPEKINFQSILRNKEGEILANKAVSLKINILEGAINGPIKYVETHIKTTDKSGLISLQIGTGSIISGSFKGIKWGNSSHFIKLEADFEGGSQFILLGTQLLLSVPYALFSNVADTVLHVKTETDPLFDLSVAKGITQADTTHWNRKTGNTTGDMQVWNGTSWENVSAGLPGQLLTISSMGIPIWQPSPNIVLPTVNLSGLYKILPFSIDFSADISSDGGGQILAKGIVYSTHNLPTLLDFTIMRGPDAGSFTGSISSLLPNTTYYIRAFATNNLGTRYSNQLLENTSLIATDIDGNMYPGIKIGTQTWLSKNLNVTKYQNNDNIDHVISSITWLSLVEGAWAYSDNSSSYGGTYGKLYNWFAATDQRKICPIGWKIPSDEDWTILTDFLGGLDVAGGKLKSTGISLWQIPNNWANNLSYFSGLPGGYRDESGQFLGLGYYGLWWSSTSDGTNALSRYVYNEFNYASKDSSGKNQGLAIRCLME